LGIFNKNIHTVSSYHVYLEKLYEIETNKKNINSDNFEINEDDKSNVAIKVTNLNFKYLGMEKYMFENINLEIPKNEHTILVGPNGSGKSTLLGLLTGIFYPNEGTVAASSKNFGYVSATPMIINDSLRANLVYGNTNNIKDEDLLQFITDFRLFNDSKKIDLNRHISNKSLSTGQMQKVSFIRAMAAGIDILVLDESTSNLDLETKKLIFNIIERQKITIINSTHNPEDFIGINNKITITQNGDERLIHFEKL